MSSPRRRSAAGTALTSPIRHVDYLLLGGGLASATAAETLRRHGAEGSIVIVSAEDHLPYHRPPLSGRLMKIDVPLEPRQVLKPSDYQALDIEVLRGVRATGVQAARHLVQTQRTPRFPSSKLTLLHWTPPTSGCSPCRHPRDAAPG